MATKVGAAKLQEVESFIELNFPEKGKVQPSGYVGLGIGQEVTITLKGKVQKLGPSWGTDKGAHITVTPTSCEITVPAAEQTTLAAAINAADKCRKKVK